MAQAQALSTPLPDQAAWAPAAVEVDRVPELDGVRAIAIGLVLAIHTLMSGRLGDEGASFHGIERALFLVVSHFWLGVDLFFVLSGFLITGILLDTKQRTTYFRDFWIRRALRILPLVLAVVVTLGLIYRASLAFLAMATFFAVDFAPLAHVRGPRAMGPMWSLAVEEQFYLLWPFAVYVLRPRAVGLVAIAIVVLEPILRGVFSGASTEVIWFRSDGLALGALAALAVRAPWFTALRARKLVAGAAGMVVLLFGLDLVLRNEAFSRGLRISEADFVFFALIIAAFAWQGSPQFAVLRSRPMRFVAATSFCAYLVHMPLVDLFDGSGYAAHLSSFSEALLRAAFVVPATFLVAFASRHWLELPFLRLKRRFAP